MIALESVCTKEGKFDAYYNDDSIDAKGLDRLPTRISIITLG
jgi:hypothetical protein